MPAHWPIRVPALASELEQMECPTRTKQKEEMVQTASHTFRTTRSVEMVQDLNTGSIYARNIIRNVYTSNMKEARRRLQNEVDIMKRLADHHHIVKVHATYIAKGELAIILS
jgi:predicted Mrr-cat superfamily restriction endonuclease